MKGTSMLTTAIQQRPEAPEGSEPLSTKSSDAGEAGSSVSHSQNRTGIGQGCRFSGKAEPATRSEEVPDGLRRIASTLAGFDASMTRVVGEFYGFNSHPPL
jgi:hypothetical protein